MSKMSTECIMLAVVFAIATESLFRYLSLFIEKLQLWFETDDIREKIPHRRKKRI